MWLELGGQPRAVPKLVRDMQNPSVGTLRRGHPGMRPANQLGSPPKCIRKKSNRCSPTFQHPPFEHGLEFRAGTLVGFVKDTARIHGTGRRLRSS